MAFNIATFKTRALSAVFFVAIMLAGLLWNQWSFLALFLVIHTGCWWEFYKLMDQIDPKFQQVPAYLRYLVMALGVAFMFWMSSPLSYPLWVSWNLHDLGWYLILVIGALTLLAGLISFKKLSLDSVLSLVAGFLYISLAWALMIKLRGRITAGFQADLGWVLPIILIASIWINDTMAYITGSLFGRTPLSSVSPKKTWEGTIGGIILAVMVVSYGGHGLFDLPFRPLIFISLLASVIGTLGDLLESKIKRMAGVKDSGQMMPGHGGFLDRFDSLLLATPYVWIFADLFL